MTTRAPAVLKRIFCPKTTKFGPKLAFLVNFDQAMPAHLVPYWCVGWWLWRAGCISQDTYLLYINTLRIDNRGRLYTFPGIVLTKQNNNKWKLPSRTVAQTRRADCRRYKPVLSRLQTPPHLAFGLVQQAKLAEELSLGLGLE